MKKQIRRGVYETNSSSCHSLTMCMKSDYDKWKDDDLFLFKGSDYGYIGEAPQYNHFYTRDEAISFERNNRYSSINECKNDDEIMNNLHENEWYDYDYFWDEYCEYYDTFEDSMTTTNGEEVVSFGYYGHD